MSVRFLGVYPIGGTKVMELPVKFVGPAVAFYTRVMGFEAVERGGRGAKLRRDGALIGLAENGDDPDQASCYFAVEGLDELHAELVVMEPSPIGPSEHEGKKFRVFFAREPY